MKSMQRVPLPSWAGAPRSTHNGNRERPPRPPAGQDAKQQDWQCGNTVRAVSTRSWRASVGTSCPPCSLWLAGHLPCACALTERSLRKACTTSERDRRGVGLCFLGPRQCSRWTRSPPSTLMSQQPPCSLLCPAVLSEPHQPVRAENRPCGGTRTPSHLPFWEGHQAVVKICLARL